jgi:hypothetical protein
MQPGIPRIPQIEEVFTIDPPFAFISSETAKTDRPQSNR